MPFTSSCPKCQKPVTVPDGVGAASLVRCPLCEVEFELREAMGPPALVVIEARTDDGQPMVPVPVPVGAEMALAEAQPAAADLSDDDRWAAGWASADETAVAEHAEGEHAEGESDAAVFGAITGKLPPAEGGDGVSLPPRLPGVEGGEAAEPLRRRRRRPRQEHPIRVFFGCIISAALGRRRGLLGRELLRRREKRHAEDPAPLLLAHLPVLVLVDAVALAGAAGRGAAQGGRRQRPADHQQCKGGRHSCPTGRQLHATGPHQFQAGC